jgi:uncharacterized membrane protein YkgB
MASMVGSGLIVLMTLGTLSFLITTYYARKLDAATG